MNPTISETCVVTVTPAKDDTGLPGISANISALGNGSLPFNDVTARDYFYDAVLWAVEHGITKGTSAKTFSPDATVTRAQVVTFLWRANGQPAAGNSGFADVSVDKYYATAVAWAVFQSITTGTGFGVFCPGAACTRVQIITFLYRAN